MNENIVRLKNKYSGLIVFTKNYDDVNKYGDYKFIRVFEENNPERTYLANRDAFEILNK
jgi:hypothetical protein